MACCALHIMTLHLCRKSCLPLRISKIFSDSALTEYLRISKVMAPCERIIACHWGHFNKWAQLSSTALTRIASGVSAALVSVRQESKKGSY